MKFSLNILLLFALFSFGVPIDVQASCCETETSTCHTDIEKDHDEEPCGNSSCDCICCGSVSLILLEKNTLQSEPLDDIHAEVFLHTSLPGSFFQSAIWQPPKFG